MDFNFPDKRGTGIERLVPHADPDMVEIMKKLIRYDPDERLLARQALKDPYFRDFRYAEKERATGPAGPLAATSPVESQKMEGEDKKREPKKGKAGMSASSSTVSIDISDAQEAQNV